MLFDLKGKRRRVVQVVYVFLALIFVLGFVGSGIGSDVSGGVFDLFGSGSGSSNSNGNSIVEKAVKRDEARLRANPRDAVALKDLTRKHYQLAGSDFDQQKGYGKDGRRELQAAATAWERYLVLRPHRPEQSLLNLMLQVYDGLGQTAKGAKTAELLTEVRPRDPAAFLQLARFARVSKQDRVADLAGQKALELARSGAERKSIKQQLDLYKQVAAQAAVAKKPSQGTTP